MRTLNKFTSIKYIENCVKYGIYASRIDQVNDPYEGAGIENPDLFRIVCLTNAISQMLMWAYYGNHHGCRIEYDISAIPENVLRDVQYVDEFQDHSDMTPKEIIQSLYKKGSEWKKEQEVRAVYYRPYADSKLWTNVGNDIYLKAPVVSVMFGLLVGEGNDAEVEDYHRMLCDLKNHPEILVKKAKLRNGKYQIVASTQFDIDEEITKCEIRIRQNQTKRTELEVRNRERLSEWIHYPPNMTANEKIMLAREPWIKFEANNWIIRDSNVVIPEYGNGLVKVEPYDLGDFELRVLLGGKTIEENREKHECYVVGCIRYSDITEILDYGTQNYPYPTINCIWDNGPFYRIVYIDQQTMKEYNFDNTIR